MDLMLLRRHGKDNVVLRSGRYQHSIGQHCVRSSDAISSAFISAFTALYSVEVSIAIRPLTGIEGSVSHPNFVHVLQEA